MKKWISRAFSLLLCLVMLAALVPSGMAQAAQPAETVPAGTAYYINPFYKDLYTPEQAECFGYRISEIRIVEPNETWILNDFGDTRLTLVTCTDDGSQRLIVVAKAEEQIKTQERR